MYFKTEADVAQNLINYFFSNFDSQKTLPLEGSKNLEVKGYFLKPEALHTEFNERDEAATSSYSAVNFLKYIYLVLVAKNH